MLKRIGLTIAPKQYYNLLRNEQAFKLSPQEEALLLLHYLESQNVHVVVDEQYVLDERGEKKDRLITCIVWWTSAQIQMARRFVSDMLAQTDATFNTNEKRLLLQCFIGIDNTNSTFEFLQAFSTAESARNIRFILQVLQDYFFYDCPGFAVLAGDFGSGLSAGFAQKQLKIQEKLSGSWHTKGSKYSGKTYQKSCKSMTTRCRLLDLNTSLTLKQLSSIQIGYAPSNLL